MSLSQNLLYSRSRRVSGLLFLIRYSISCPKYEIQKSNFEFRDKTSIYYISITEYYIQYILMRAVSQICCKFKVNFLNTVRETNLLILNFWLKTFLKYVILQKNWHTALMIHTLNEELIRIIGACKNQLQEIMYKKLCVRNYMQRNLVNIKKNT